MPWDKKAIKELEGIVGPGKLIKDPASLLCYSYDAYSSTVTPRAVVFPESTDDVVKVVGLADRYGFSVVPRGAGTGRSGGSLPVEESVVVSFERMDRIEEIGEKDMLAVVQPGVVTGVLKKAVEARGLFYPPDPASVDFCTIGGNVAECAGGMRAVKYGVTRDYVMGLEVVLPDGEVIHTGGRTKKGVVGYDITRLMVGSEGTLGMITKVILRLIPHPHFRLTLRAVFHDIKGAARCVEDIIASKTLPSAMEIMDNVCLDLIRKDPHLNIPEDADAILLLELDGSVEISKTEADEVRKICRYTGAEVSLSSDENGTDDLWAARRSLSPSMGRLYPHRINEDVTVPISRIPDLFSAVEKLGRKYEIPIACFGHAGDGNIHVNLLIQKEEERKTPNTISAIEDLFQNVVDMGGTISGEHGVGISKGGYLHLELEPQLLATMKGIKETIDPKNIMNPGKIFPIN